MSENLHERFNRVAENILKYAAPIAESQNIVSKSFEELKGKGYTQHSVSAAKRIVAFLDNKDDILKFVEQSRSHTPQNITCSTLETIERNLSYPELFATMKLTIIDGTLSSFDECLRGIHHIGERYSTNDANSVTWDPYPKA